MSIEFGVLSQFSLLIQLPYVHGPSFDFLQSRFHLHIEQKLYSSTTLIVLAEVETWYDNPVTYQTNLTPSI